MTQIIPVTNDASQEFTAIGFDFKFEWNTTDSGWRMSLSLNGAVLIAGLRLVTNIFLLDAYSLGIGDFLLVNTESVSEDPVRGAWDDGSFILIYYTEQEKTNALSASS